MHWELEELEKALYEGDIQLAKRYVSKLKVLLFCVKCKQPIAWTPLECHEYFKGFVHEECSRKEKL
jgi:hypothetical protein